MPDGPNRDAIRKYFRPFPKRALWAVLLGVVAAFLGGSVDLEPIPMGYLLIGGLISALGGALTLWLDFKGRPTDSQMDAWLEDDLRRLLVVSLGRLGLDESDCVADPVDVVGPILWGAPGVARGDIVWKRGKDGVMRFGVYGVQLIHFAENFLACYGCSFSFVRGAPGGETTDEYFYSDVVSVATKTVAGNQRLPDGSTLRESQTFVLTTSGGTSVSVLISDPQILRFTDVSALPQGRAERAVAGVRKMLRAKKA